MGFAGQIRPFDEGVAGVLSDADIRALMQRGSVRPADESRIQPASLDLALSGEAVRVRSSFLPGQEGKVADFIHALAIKSFSLGDGAVLEPGGVYLVALADELRLPAAVSARCNPKSSTGRIDVFVRVIGDGFSSFDDVPAGYTGKLWLEIAPRTFPIIVRPGSRLAQMRFRSGHAVVSDEEIFALEKRADGGHPFLQGGDAMLRGGLALTIDLAPKAGPVGFRARRNAGAIDVDAVGALDPLDFWEPLRLQAGGVILEPNEFYILASHEAMCVPAGFAAEMVAFDAGIAEARIHYAGFMDPGFGCDAPSRAVLEVRPHDVPFLVTHRQTVCRIVYERMASMPSQLYGSGSNYQGQGLRLSKAFLPWPAPQVEPIPKQPFWRSRFGMKPRASARS
ncbi:2'-deoxycytidine 5'-triphosphate deaminase family protein (plasmid) [Bosea sp. RAC05]|nr:2'-deoxycytidine 5'-triphosphate deaminase family protein [Bosea sp. RAC05]